MALGVKNQTGSETSICGAADVSNKNAIEIMLFSFCLGCAVNQSLPGKRSQVYRDFFLSLWAVPPMPCNIDIVSGLHEIMGFRGVYRCRGCACPEVPSPSSIGVRKF